MTLTHPPNSSLESSGAHKLAFRGTLTHQGALRVQHRLTTTPKPNGPNPNETRERRLGNSNCCHSWVRTSAPRGDTPVLRARLTHEYSSVMRGITPAATLVSSTINEHELPTLPHRCSYHAAIASSFLWVASFSDRCRLLPLSCSNLATCDLLFETAAHLGPQTSGRSNACKA